MLQLVQFTNNQKPDPSPFCTKIDLFLRVTGLKFEIKVGDPRKAPKKKLPYITDDNQHICDSSHIIRHLSQKHNIDLNSHLSDEEKSISYAMSKLIEEYLYFILVYSRWVDLNGWEIMRKEFFSTLPTLLKSFVPSIVQKQVKKSLFGQGISRHSEEEIYLFAEEGIQSLSLFLGDKKYFMGDKISLLDITAFSLLYNILEIPKTTKLHRLCLEKKNIKEFVNRIYQHYYK